MEGDGGTEGTEEGELSQCWKSLRVERISWKFCDRWP